MLPCRKSAPLWRSFGAFHVLADVYNSHASRRRSGRGDAFANWRAASAWSPRLDVRRPRVGAGRAGAGRLMLVLAVRRVATSQLTVADPPPLATAADARRVRAVILAPSPAATRRTGEVEVL